MKKIILFSFLALTLIQCKKESNQNNKQESKVSLTEETRIKTYTVGAIGQYNNISSLGTVVSSNEAKPAFKTGGVIQRTFVKEGANVKKGQLLATLQMNEIEAQVRQAEEGLSKTERDLARVKNLFADSVATLEQLQNVTTAFEVAKKTVEIAKFNMKYSEIRSPISGKIVKQIMHDGEIVGPGTPVYAIMGIGTADWKITAGLQDRDWARIKVGDKAIVKFDAYPGKEFNAIVKDKSAIGGHASGNIDIELRLINQPANLAAGLLANVQLIPTTKSTITTIPIEALSYSNGNQAEVFIVNGNKVKAKMITIGKILSSSVEVISGLNKGDIIATTGTKYIEDGDAIIIE